MTNQPDPNDAPPGYRALPEAVEDSCRGCAFEGQEMFVCGPLPCLDCERADGCNVIFVPKERLDAQST